MSNFIKRAFAALTIVFASYNAVVNGDYETAKFLIEAGADVNAEDIYGSTPLHVATRHNNLPVIKLLVENGASIYATTKPLTPIMECNRALEGFDECYNYLMHVQNNLGIMNDGVVYALYDYKAQEDDELSFTIGDKFKIIRRDNSQEQRWWAQKRTQPNDEREGYIPRNLVGLYPRVEVKKQETNHTGVKDEL